MAAIPRTAGEYRTTDVFMIRYSIALVENSGMRIALQSDIGSRER